MSTDVGQLIKENKELKAKIKRFESLIANSIDALKMLENHAHATDAQRGLAKEALLDFFAEQPTYIYAGRLKKEVDQ